MANQNYNQDINLDLAYKEWIGEIENIVKEQVDKLSNEMLSEIIQSSPVKTGFYKSKWTLVKQQKGDVYIVNAVNRYKGRYTGRPHLIDNDHTVFGKYRYIGTHRIRDTQQRYRNELDKALLAAYRREK